MFSSLIASVLVRIRSRYDFLRETALIHKRLVVRVDSEHTFWQCVLDKVLYLFSPFFLCRVIQIVEVCHVALGDRIDTDIVVAVDGRIADLIDYSVHSSFV